MMNTFAEGPPCRKVAGALPSGSEGGGSKEVDEPPADKIHLTVQVENFDNATI
jgi:hypothetical protein